MNKFSYTLQWIADYINGNLTNGANLSCAINRLAPLEKLNANTIGFIESTKYIKTLTPKTSGSIIIRDEHYQEFKNVINPSLNIVIHSNPYLAFAKLTKIFDTYYSDSLTQSIHKSAVIGDNVTLGDDVSIAANAVIEDEAIIGANSFIGANSTVGRGAKIGSDSFLHANSTVAHGCITGDHCILHSGSVIGGDGFGLATDEKGSAIKIYHLGKVILGDSVEVGCNSCIDRGALDDTVIHDGVKIDNEVQIGHNCIIGKNTRIVAQVAMAGSVTVGENCIIAGQAAIGGHITITDNVVIFGQAGVSGSIDKPGQYGSRRPLLEKNQMLKCATAYKHLPEMRKQLKALTTNIEV